MARNILRKRENLSFRTVAWVVILAFSFSLITPPTQVYAQPMAASPMPALPPVGAMVSVSPSFIPPTLQGIKINPNEPLQFDFFIVKGDSPLEGKEFEKEASKLIKYFLASLTTPEEDLWVNLSPYEKNRIIPNQFSTTEM